MDITRIVDILEALGRDASIANILAFVRALRG
jgi:hypothetical protein